MKGTFTIKNLKVKVDHREIIKGLSLSIKPGEIHALMGPNASGKSTLALALMGHPHYQVTGGKITIGRENIVGLSPEKRAKLGLFLSFQYPQEVSGISFLNFLRTAYNNLKGKKGKELSLSEFKQLLHEKLKLLKIDSSFLKRYLNAGFSGGEKKKAEILQLAVLEPRIAILDETDSGLDIDALKIVAQGIKKIYQEQKMAILLITHYQRILNYIQPDFVHVLIDGQIVKSGDRKLALEVERIGYSKFRKEKVKGR